MENRNFIDHTNVTTFQIVFKTKTDVVKVKIFEFLVKTFKNGLAINCKEQSIDNNHVFYTMNLFSVNTFPISKSICVPNTTNHFRTVHVLTCLVQPPATMLMQFSCSGNANDVKIWKRTKNAQ